MIASWQENYDKPRWCAIKQRYHSADNGAYNQGSDLPSGHVWLLELDSGEGKMPKYWCLPTVVLEKTPKSPARRLNQSILKEINPEYSLEGLMLKLKLQHFGDPMWTHKSSEKSLMLGKIEGRRRREHETARWHHRCNGRELGQTLGDVRDREAWHAAVQRS